MKVEIKKASRGFIVTVECQRDAATHPFGLTAAAHYSQAFKEIVKEEAVFEDWSELQKYIRKIFGVYE